MPRLALAAIALVAVAAGLARFSGAEPSMTTDAAVGVAPAESGFGQDDPPVTLPAPLPLPPTPETAEAEEAEPAIAKSPPRVVRIPAIDVEATVIDLGLEPDGALETPKDYAKAGWWAGGTTANEPGPTVIVGHVDDYRGPAVFFRLGELDIGDEIEVVDATGTVSRFVVTDAALYDKDNFPTERVYGPTGEATLRLITCGGAFDRANRSYEGNVVVYAEPL